MSVKSAVAAGTGWSALGGNVTTEHCMDATVVGEARFRGARPMIATIAIIDDDDAVRDSTRAMLECNDYAVREHPSAEDFLSQPRDDVDCVLVDHHMPGMTGLELLERLRADGDMTPALVITGRPDSTMAHRVERVGAKLLHKPTSAEHLVRTIENTRRTRSKPGT